MRFQLNEVVPGRGAPPEAVIQSLCETKTALQVLLASINSLEALQMDVLKKLSEILEAIKEGSDQAKKAIEESKNFREEIKNSVNATKDLKEAISIERGRMCEK